MTSQPMSMEGETWKVDLSQPGQLPGPAAGADIRVNNAGFQHVSSVPEHGVTSNTICPAYVRTPLVEGQIAGRARARARAHGIPEAEVIEHVMLREPAIKRLVEPAGVAAAVAYLCGPTAGFVTGASIVIDGGLTAR
jgi:hypothetical protein